MLHSFGWIFFLLIALSVIGLGLYMEIGRRKRAAAERRAVWKAHQDWLRSSGLPTSHAAREGGGAKILPK